MPETPQQYTERILGYVEGKDALKIQRSTARELKQLTKGLSKKELSKRPAPGKWSIREILAHMADTEAQVRSAKVRTGARSSWVLRRSARMRASSSRGLNGFDR